MILGCLKINVQICCAAVHSFEMKLPSSFHNLRLPSNTNDNVTKHHLLLKSSSSSICYCCCRCCDPIVFCFGAVVTSLLNSFSLCSCATDILTHSPVRVVLNGLSDCASVSVCVRKRDRRCSQTHSITCNEFICFLSTFKSNRLL